MLHFLYNVIKSIKYQSIIVRFHIYRYMQFIQDNITIKNCYIYLSLFPLSNIQKLNQLMIVWLFNM